MNQPVSVPAVNVQQLYTQYGEAMLQLKIATSRVQQIEVQLQQIINVQAPQA